MALINETRVLNIADRIINLDGARQLADLLNQEYKIADSDRAELSYSATCDDGSSFQSESIDLFSPESIIGVR